MSRERYGLAAGVLIIIASCIMFFFGLISFLAGFFSIGSGTGFFLGMGVVELFGSVFGLVGGILMLKRRAFALVIIGNFFVLAGGILAILPTPIRSGSLINGYMSISLWPVGLPIFLLSVIGMIFIFVARRDFR